MAVGPAIFQTVGQRSEHYVPGAYSRSTAVGGVTGGVSANIGVILGRSKGGEPNKLFAFSTLSEAVETLIDGELLKAVAHAFNPSPEYAPQAIRAMVVNGNTQASSVLTAGNREILRLKTASWGVVANTIARQIVNGTNIGTKKLKFSTGEIEESIDNIGKKSLQIQYTGDGTAAVLDINNIGLSVEVTKDTNRPAIDINGLEKLRVGEQKVFTISTTNPEAAAVDIVAKMEFKGIDLALFTFEYYDTGTTSWKPLDVNTPFGGPAGFALANTTMQFRITPLAGAEGGILEYAVTLLEVVDSVQSTNVIAKITTGQTEIAAEGNPYASYFIPAYDVNSGSVFLPFEDFPTIEELIQRLNGTGEFAVIQLDKEANVPSSELDLVDSLDITEAKILTSNFYALFYALENSPWVGRGNVQKVDGAPNIMPDNDPEWVFFEGASAGSYTVNDWNKTLAALEAEEVQIISSPVTDHAVHLLVSNHCTAMSNVQNRKERTAILGGRIGETIEEAIEFAMSLNNRLVSYCYPAISATSPLTGTAEELPASYFASKLLGLECTVAVNEPLTNKSVSVLRFLVKLKITDMEKLIIGGVLCGGVVNDKRLKVIRAMTTHNGNQLQHVERSMVREDLYMNRDIRLQYEGGVGRPGVDKLSDLEETLQTAARGWKGEGLIIPTDDGKNIWGVKIRKNGDKNYIEFHRNLTAPNNFFFVTAYNYVYDSGTSMEL
jgi:hypothetical protein